MVASEGQGCIRSRAWHQVCEGLRRAVRLRWGVSARDLEREIESYGTYDRLDEDLTSSPEKYAAFREVSDILEFGPTRLMGDWPESQFNPDEE